MPQKTHLFNIKNNPFRLGLRTIKTGLAVFLCLLIFHIFHREMPMIACLSAVFAMRQDVNTTMTFGASRIGGNLIGGILGLVYFLLTKQFDTAFTFDLFIIPLMVMLLIIIADALNLNAGIIGASATFLMIIFTVSESQSFIYALNRVLDTVIGTVIAIATNHFFMPYQEKNKLENSAVSKVSPPLEVINADQQKQIVALKEEIAALKIKND